MRNIWCLLGIHDFERVSKPVPTKSCNEFNCLAQSYALGRCKRCSEFRMVECCGGLEPYYPSAVKTQREWLDILIPQAKLKE